MRQILKIRRFANPEIQGRLADALGVISLFVLLGLALHLPLLA